MKINGIFKNKKLNPAIITNVSGTIIYINQDAIMEFGVKIGQNVSNIVDINELQKLSMYSNRMSIISITHPKYSEAYASISGDGINKTISITFKKGYKKSSKDLIEELNILSITNRQIERSTAKDISLNDFCQEIKKTISDTGNFINVYTQNESFYQNEHLLQALALCGIGMMQETSPNKPVDFYLKRINGQLEMKIIVRVNSVKEGRGAQEVENILPWCAIRLAVIDNLCEQNKLSYTVNLVERSLKLVIKAKQVAIDTILHSSPNTTSLVKDLYQLLYPRENIISKYGISIEEIIE